MFTEPALPERLISRIYGSIAEPGAWQRTLEHHMRAVGGDSAFIFAKDGVSRTQGYIAVSGIKVANHLEGYFSYFAARNPYDHVFRHRPEGDVRNVGAFAFSASYRRSEWFNEWAKPQGYGDSIGCHLVRQKDFSCFLSVRRLDRLGAFSPAELALAKATVPHFGHALKVLAQVERERLSSQSFAQALDGISAAVFIVDTNGKILRMNCVAEAHISAESGLASNRGHLGARHHGAAMALLNAIRGARQPPSLSQAVGTNIIVPREDGRRPLIVRVMPIASRAAWGDFAPRAGVAAVFVTDPEMQRERPIDLFAAAYSLTARERAILSIIVEGEGLPRAAETLGVAVTTARTHLQQIFQKTGTVRQAELVRLFFDTVGT
jgi:DNA-binding CsgD family transcriptional regulator